MSGFADAVAIAISPIPVALVLVVLVSERARVNGTAFAVGWFGAVLVVAAVAFAVADPADAGAAGDDGVRPLRLALGVLFAALAVRRWTLWRRHGPRVEEPRWLGRVGAMPPALALGVGVAAIVANPKDLPLSVRGGLAVAEGGATGASATLALVGFALAASVTVVGPVVATIVLGDRLREPYARARTWLVAHDSLILAVLFALLAVESLLTGSGLVG